jgi:hypothetical protein
MLSVENTTAKFITGCRRAITHPLQFRSLENCYSTCSYCIAMASKKRVELVLNAEVKVVEASETDKLKVKQTVGKFKIGRTHVYDILKSKSDIKREWLTGNGSQKGNCTRGNQN